MSEYNYARRMGTMIKDPKVLFLAARADGRTICKGDFPAGDFSVEGDAIDYMLGTSMGRVWWTTENMDVHLEVDVRIVDTGELHTVVRAAGQERWAVGSPALALGVPALKSARAALETPGDLTPEDISNIIDDINDLLVTVDRKDNEETPDA